MPTTPRPAALPVLPIYTTDVEPLQITALTHTYFTMWCVLIN